MARINPPTKEWEETGTKYCPQCLVEKPVSSFVFNSKGIPGWCKLCTTEKMREYQAKHREKNKAYLRDWYLKATYQLTPQEYALKVLEQGGACAICNTASDGLCVDHDHDTGEVRGLLCRTCNSGIGMLKDDLDLVKNAVAYLTKYKKEDN